MSRSFWVAAVLAVGIVAAVALYANTVLQDVQKREDKINKEFAERAVALRDLDKLYPYTPRKTLDPARMKPYLEVRRNVAAQLKKREEEPADDNRWHARQTRNEMLLWLTAELNAHKMSFAEYRAITRRWQAILALGRRIGLLGSWQAVVKTEKHPDGLPLPPPAKDASEEEQAILRQHEKDIEATLRADLLGPLIDDVANGVD